MGVIAAPLGVDIGEACDGGVWLQTEGHVNKRAFRTEAFRVFRDDYGDCDMGEFFRTKVVHGWRVLHMEPEDGEWCYVGQEIIEWVDSKHGSPPQPGEPFPLVTPLTWMNVDQ